MSDFVNAGWGLYVTVISLLSIAGCAYPALECRVAKKLASVARPPGMSGTPTWSS